MYHIYVGTTCLLFLKHTQGNGSFSVCTNVQLNLWNGWRVCDMSLAAATDCDNWQTTPGDALARGSWTTSLQCPVVLISSSPVKISISDAPAGGLDIVQWTTSLSVVLIITCENDPTNNACLQATVGTMVFWNLIQVKWNWVFYDQSCTDGSNTEGWRSAWGCCNLVCCCHIQSLCQSEVDSIAVSIFAKGRRQCYLVRSITAAASPNTTR